MSSAKDIVQFPLTVLKYAGKGIQHLKSLIFKTESTIDPNRLEGAALTAELNKVKQQSNEFSRKF